MPLTTENFAHTWFDEAWNKGNETVIDTMVQPDVKVYGFPEPTSVTNLEGFRQSYHLFRQTFSNIHIEIEDQAVQGDKIANRWTATGTHTGDALGFPATGKSVTFSGVSFVHLRDGKISASWNYFDFPGVVAKLRSS